MKIYIVRHGETTGDIEGRYGGTYDDHLTEKGSDQLEKTSKDLVGKSIETIFSSPLIRARESAEIISTAIDSPIEVVEGLRERNYGVLGGLTKEGALEKYPEAVELHKDPQNTDPEGEPYENFRKRVLETFLSLAKRGYRTIAIVSHSGPIRQILTRLGLPLPEKIGDGEIIEVDVDAEGKLS